MAGGLGGGGGGGGVKSIFMKGHKGKNKYRKKMETLRLSSSEALHKSDW